MFGDLKNVGKPAQNEKCSKIEARFNEHKILNQPYLGGFLLFLWAFVFSQIFVSVLSLCFGKKSANFVEISIRLGLIISSFILLFIHKKWFCKEYKGSFNSKNLLKKDVIIIFAVVVLVDFLLLLLDLTGHFVLPGFTTLTVALSAGIFEEVWCRVLPVSIMMKNPEKTKSVYFVAAFSALLFSLPEIINLFAGALFTFTALEILYVLSFGFFLAALFIRTGNILPCMIFHGIHEFIFLMQDQMDLIEKELHVNIYFSTENVLISLLFILAGCLLIRKSKKQEIFSLWKERWSK